MREGRVPGGGPRSAIPHSTYERGGLDQCRGRQGRRCRSIRKVGLQAGTKRHAHVPIRPYLSRFSTSLASEDAAVPQAAATTAEDASGCTTHTRLPPLAGPGGTGEGHRAGD